MKVRLRSYKASGLLFASIALAGLGSFGCSKLTSATHPQSKSSGAGAPVQGATPLKPMPTMAKAASPHTTDDIQWLFVDNERPIPVVGNFEQHFASARQANSRNDKVLTAIELRSAAQSLSIKPSGTVSLVNPSLEAAARNFNQLATQAESEKLDDSKLMKAFAVAYDADLQSGSPGTLSDQWMKAYDEPAKHLTAARDLLSKDTKLAATELRKAKAFVDIDVSRSNGIYKNLLTSEANQLAQSSSQLAASKPQDGAKLQHLGAEVTRVMAEFGLHNADVAWQAHDVKITAQWLNSAVSALKSSLSWTGLTDHDISASLAAAGDYASRVRDGSRVDNKEMSKELDSAALDMKKVLMKGKPLNGESSAVAALTTSKN